MSDPVPGHPTPYRAAATVRARWELPGVLLALFAAIWVVLAVSPVNREDWLLENLLVFIAVAALIATRKRLRFSNASYLCLFTFLVLHSIGAHYTYALVPYDDWWRTLTGNTLSELMGLSRNHYDRLVHFLYGVLILPPSAEIITRYAAPRSGWRWFIPVFFVMSQSLTYEIIEWIAAIIVAPELGTAYLGTQGDEWDAQQDMALATLGAVISASLIWFNHRSHHAR
jgi:putative membrane protein